MDKIKELYQGGQREFNADNGVYGDTAPGELKWLYLEWKNSNGEEQDQTVWEDKSWDKITLPDDVKFDWVRIN